MDNKKALVVFSGGLDSTVLLYKCVKLNKYREVNAVTFSYGSKHNYEEAKRAEKTANILGVKWQKIEMDFIGQIFKSNLLQNGGDIPEGHYSEAIMKKTVVPFRNGIMLAIAAGLAESNELDLIVLGNHHGDHAIYPDCRPSFISSMADAIKNGTYSNLQLESPFCDWTKSQIIEMGDDIDTDFKNTYSCYKGGEVHCGVCSTCFERREAFHNANINDPTEYLDNQSIESLIEKNLNRLTNELKP